MANKGSSYLLDFFECALGLHLVLLLNACTSIAFSQNRGSGGTRTHITDRLVSVLTIKLLNHMKGLLNHHSVIALRPYIYTALWLSCSSSNALVVPRGVEPRVTVYKTVPQTVEDKD